MDQEPHRTDRLIPVLVSEDPPSECRGRLTTVINDPPFLPISDPGEFECALTQRVCALVTLGALKTPEHLLWLRDLVGRHSALGWIIMADFNPGDVCRLLSLGARMDVVWIHEGEGRLLNAVAHMVVSDPFSHLTGRLEEAEIYDQDLRSALASVCLLYRPPASITGLSLPAV